MGSEGPPELTAFLLERAFYAELGWTREDLLSRPLRQVEDYAFFIEMLNRERSRKK